jgi:FAD-linked sulfhydryl oxidase
MIKQTRRPLLLTVSLLVIIGLIYAISGSNSPVEGIKPVNLAKNVGDFSLTNQIPESKPIALNNGYSEESVLDNDKEIATDEHEKEVVDKAAKDDTKSVKAAAGANDDTVLADGFGEFTDTPFMPKMANETLKAQLGNAAWRLFHTILARYPDNPSEQEQTTLRSYIQLFAQVYPCGDCARHFQQLLRKYPPQVSSRKNAALWGCAVHNKVNERLQKPEYDCTTILEDYDCGCGDDEKEVDVTLGGKTIDSLKKVEVEEEDEQYGK